MQPHINPHTHQSKRTTAIVVPRTCTRTGNSERDFNDEEREAIFTTAEAARERQDKEREREEARERVQRREDGDKPGGVMNDNFTRSMSHGCGREGEGGGRWDHSRESEAVIRDLAWIHERTLSSALDLVPTLNGGKVADRCACACVCCTCIHTKTHDMHVSSSSFMTHDMHVSSSSHTAHLL